MAENKEMELKLRFLDPAQWGQIFEATVVREYGDSQSYQREMLEAQYYDTLSHRLQDARLAFRIRREGGQWIAVVKGGGSCAGGLHHREEWSIPVEEPIASVIPFLDTPVGLRLKEAVGDEPLIAIASTRFERQVMLVHTPDGSVVELAADRGEIQAGDMLSPIMELELELKSGNSASLLQLGAALARDFALLPEWKSKYFRALQLAGVADDGESSAPSRPKVKDGEAAGKELHKLLIYSLQAVLTAQEDFLQTPEDPETLHQVRVQLRRLRSLLSFCRPLIAEEEYQARQETLRQWESSMGSLREIDVTRDAWAEVIKSETIQFSVRPVLGDKLEDRRTSLVTQLHETLTHGQSTPMLLDMWAWLAELDLARQGEEGAALTLMEFARDRLTGWLRTMINAGKNIDINNATAIHELRIRGKKARYVLELLDFILPGKAEQLIEQLKSVQDGLGYLHDVHVNQELINELLKTQSSRLLYRDTGLLTGWQAQKAENVHQKLNKQWKNFRRLGKVWIKKKVWTKNCLKDK